MQRVARAPVAHILLALLVAACMAGGCYTISGEGGWGGARMRLPESTPAGPRDAERVRAPSVLHPRAGTTTAEAVRGALGPADYVTEDGRFYGYLVERFRATGGLELYGGRKPVGPTYRRVSRDLLVLQFDADGVLRRRGTVGVPEDGVPSSYFEVTAHWWVAYGEP